MSQATATPPPDEPDDRHPDFAEEEAKLAEVLRVIREDIQNIRDRSPATAAYQEAADHAQMSLDEIGENLKDALAQPYFGRLDYLPVETPSPVRVRNSERLEQKRIYIGATFIDGQEVYSWTGPVARLWYTDASGFQAPHGVVRVRVDLKRYLQIRDETLIDLNDLYRRALPAAVKENTPQSPVIKAVGRVGDTQLDVIIETIDPHQYQTIANREDSVIVVQGAAGSGKSEIGLHRIAYLLLPYSDLGQMERPKPESTLFIGPSRPFLDYAADILPGLSVREGVTQTTLRQWLEDQRSASIRFQSHLWNHLLSQGELILYNEEAESFKGSLDMAAVLERYAVERSKRIGIQCVSALEGAAGGELERFRTLSRAEVQGALDTAFAPSAHISPLNKRRVDFINNVAAMARATISTRYVDERREAEGQAEAWCRRVWPRLNVREEYLALLSNPQALTGLSPKRISEALADELAEGADRASPMACSTPMRARSPTSTTC